jgi:hypothetical protein
MDVYHIWRDLTPGTSDVEFCADVARFLGHLAERGELAAYRITRRKLGLAPRDLGEFHVMIETEDMAQLERLFRSVGTRAGDVEGLHFAVNSKAVNATFALYRDFPDRLRRTGEERF